MKLTEKLHFLLTLITLVAGLTVLFCVTGCRVEKPNLAEERAILLQTDRDFSQKSVEAGAAEAFRIYLAEEALELGAGSHPVHGRNAIYEGMKPGQEQYVLAWEPQDGEAAKSSDLGYTWGKYTVTSKPETGEPVKSHGKYLNVWKKQADGSWKVLVDMGNKSPAPEMEVEEE